jgi:hypothetical protein
MAASETYDYKTRQNVWHLRYREVQNVFLSLCAPEQHWFFLQGHDAYVQELYLPALSSLLNGIKRASVLPCIYSIRIQSSLIYGTSRRIAC